MVLIWVKKRLDEDRAFSNVNKKGVGQPMAHELDKGGRNPVFSKWSSSSGMHWLAGDIFSEVMAKAWDEKLVSWDCSVFH